jgi:hypothetical protein
VAKNQVNELLGHAVKCRPGSARGHLFDGRFIMATKEQAADIKRRNSEFILGLPGVVGFGVGEDDSGVYSLIVHVESDDQDTHKRVPGQIEGCPVKIVETGRYRKR